MAMAWREHDLTSSDGDKQGSPAGLLWQDACDTLRAPRGGEAWTQIVDSSPPEGIWHSLKNCVAYQAEVWQNLLANGMPDVMQPAAFKMAIVLRHTPSDMVVKILNEMLKSHPQCQDLTSYVLALLTDDEASGCGRSEAESPGATPSGPAPPRDLLLYGDCELAVLAAVPKHYDAHARLVRAEYAHLNQANYSQLRIKILNQFMLIPKLFRTPEFEGMEATARENIRREIETLREQQQ